MTSVVAPRPAVLSEAKDLRIWSAILRVPLLGKLLGANLLIVVGGLVAHRALPQASTTMQLAVMLGLSFAANAVLVWLALRPIVQLEATAARVSQGDFSARVPKSSLADLQIAKLADTLNTLLCGVELDRARIHYLAGRSVRARDIEREAVARELRDSLAQSLSAIALKVAATRSENDDPHLEESLRQIREALHQVTDDMRTVAETLYPGTLQEFGLTNALEALARRLRRRSSIHVHVDAGLFHAQLSGRVAGALYRVADEALRNVEQHSQATQARVVLRSNGDVSLEIEDDGVGIDMRTCDPMQAGLGLFSAKTVLALVGGELQIASAPGRGTRVVARVPVEETK